MPGWTMFFVRIVLDLRDATFLCGECLNNVTSGTVVVEADPARARPPRMAGVCGWARTWRLRSVRPVRPPTPAGTMGATYVGARAEEKFCPIMFGAQTTPKVARVCLDVPGHTKFQLPRETVMERSTNWEANFQKNSVNAFSKDCGSPGPRHVCPPRRSGSLPSASACGKAESGKSNARA